MKQNIINKNTTEEGNIYPKAAMEFKGGFELHLK